MIRTSRVAPCLFFTTLLMSLLAMGLEASNPSCLDELFQNIDRQDLDSQQRIAIRAVRNRIREEQLLNPPGSSVNSQQFVSEFLLCSSGVLDDRQFQLATGTAKNPQQQLRYELRQLHTEIIRVQSLIRRMNR